MSAINWRRVIAGGVAAGVVMNLMDGLTNGVLLLSAYQANSARLGLDPKSMVSVAGASIFIATDFVFGILLVWLYATMSAQYGSGAATAIRAAVGMYLATMGVIIGFAVMGVLTLFLVSQMAIAGLVTLIVGALAGSWVYRRNETG
jgi:hypothetical protein